MAATEKAAMRLVRIIGAALPIGTIALAAGTGQAIQFTFSTASAYAEASSELCASYSSGGGSSYVCNHNNTGRVFVGDEETTQGSNEVSVSGQGEAYQYVYSTPQGPAFIEIPGSPLSAEASASTRAYENRARVSTNAFSSVTGGEDVPDAGNETRYNSSDASAFATSSWAEEITFTGAATLGQGAMLFSIHGQISSSSYGTPLFEPDGPEGASVAFEAYEGGAGFNEMIFAVDVFDADEQFVTGGRYRAYSDGTVDADLVVLVPFTYGETYTFVGTLEVASKGFGLNHIQCTGSPGSGDYTCSVNGSSGGDSTLAFDSTVTVESLTVPEGTTVYGTGGSSLPFAVVVPEPASASLLALGLAGLYAGGRRRRAA